MKLPQELISAFVEVTNDQTEVKTESTHFGTIVEHGGTKYVRIDGSDLLTPMTTTADTKDGERVTVMIKNHKAVVMGNTSSPAARVDDLSDVGTKISEFEIVVADKVSTEQFDAEKARIDDLVADNVLIKEMLTADNANIGNIFADNVEIKKSLTANAADIETLKTTKLNATDAEILYAKVSELDAAKGRIGTLEAGVADIDTLIFGSAAGTTIQTSFANAVVAQLGNAQIKSAMIESIAASKIAAGDIITNNVRVKSEDGRLVISDETVQISDSSRVRVQIGRDASNDYSINIWDAYGNLMFSKGGITDSAIKEAIIRNDMVSDTANIAAHKLDIDSLFEEINGSTKSIKSTRVYLDEKSQSLDVVFKTLETDVSGLGESVSSQGTQLATIQGQISSKVWQQDIDTATDVMSTQYSTLDQKVDSFKSVVSSTYATKASVGDIKVGGRNLYIEKNAVDGFLSSNGDGSIMAPGGVTKEKTSDLIPVTPGDELRFQVWVTTPEESYVWYGYQFFIEDGTVLNTSRPAEHLYDTVGGRYHATYDPIVVPEGAAYIRVSARMFDDGKIKVEIGNKPTDWTPAPEDMATSYDADTAHATAEAAQETASNAETLIQQLSHSISTLVTDGNGTSLMTQTENGWTFSTADIQKNVSDVAQALNSLTSEVGDTSNAVDVLKRAVDDLGEIAEYVKIGTYEGEPCIELGESDSEFKMRITNTRILFMEGSNVVAHINNQSLHINKAVIEEELQQGDFVWQIRSNGNLGLIWKG